MNRLIVFLAIQIFLCCSCAKHLNNIQVIPDEQRWLYEICSPKYMGRRAGTPECDSVAMYISRELSNMGYEVSFQNFQYKDLMDLKNIFVFRKGISDSLIVIGAHYDGAVFGTEYPAADDNGSGVVTLLSICKRLANSKTVLNKSLLVAFWAAEEFTLESPFNGSRYYVNSLQDKKMVNSYCNIDCIGNKDQLVNFYYLPGCEKVAVIMKSLLDSMEDDSIPIVKRVKLNSDFVPFFQSNIPAFGWNDNDPSGFIHSKNDHPETISFEKIDKVARYSIEILKSL